jgi:eukaryotic-like serine/threonine-protein kinase
LAEPLAAGTILRSRYKVTRLVGGGGMGAVYQAEDLRLEGRLCAIKEVCPDLSTDQGSRDQAHAQFYREASTLARLDHPNLPKVSDYFSDDGREYLVMDFVPGKDLRQLLNEAIEKRTFLPEQQVLRWAAQLCDAVEYLHAQNPPVLHRDIKPDNARLTPGNTIKLVDFGLVKVMAPDETKTVTILQGLGTVQYTPLEQYGGDTGHTDARSDIYSLGATLYHLLTGKAPLNAKARFLKPGSMPTPRQINPQISVRTERAILRALSMHPDRRPRSIAEFRIDLFQGPIRPLEEPYIADDELGPRTPSWRVVYGIPLLVLMVLLALAIYITAFGPLGL